MAAKKRALTRFLTKLSTDPQFLARYYKATAKAKVAILKKFGLTPAQIAVVKSGDPKRLAEAVLAEQVKPGATLAIVFAVVGVVEHAFTADQ
jgi:hypothetical protein